MTNTHDEADPTPANIDWLLTLKGLALNYRNNLPHLTGPFGFAIRVHEDVPRIWLGQYLFRVGPSRGCVRRIARALFIDLKEGVQ